MSKPTVIVGTSVAGVHTAQALRANGHDGDILLVGEERDLPYDKPPLSKDFLRGVSGVEEIRLLSREAAARSGLRLLLGHRATGLQAAEQRVHLEGHAPVDYEQLVIATGSRARPSPWGEQAGVHVLRTLHDAQALRADLLRGGRLLVVGAGLIGAEIASTARALALDVTVVDPLPLPMRRILDDQLATEILALHERHGVRMLLGTSVVAVSGSRGGFSTQLSSGAELNVSTIVVGIGAEPNDRWLRDSALLIDDGVVCDEFGRALGVSNVFAVGDVARWRHPESLTSGRSEHWTNAVDQAACVAHNIARPEQPVAFAPFDYVWSDQHDWRLQLAGNIRDSSSVVRANPVESHSFVALYGGGADRQLVGAAVVNWPQAMSVCRRALRSKDTVAGALSSIDGLMQKRRPR